MEFREFKERKNFSLKKVIPLLREVGLTERADRISACGDFKDVAECQDCGTWHLYGLSSCKDRLCPICQKKRALLWFTKVTPLMREYLDKAYYVNFITFTIKDMSDLKQAIDIINKAFRYMTNGHKQLAREFKKRFIGGVQSLEVKRGKNSGLWHPHFHCLVVKYVYSKDFEWLKQAWNNALCVVTGLYGQKLGSVFIQGFMQTEQKGLETAICECFKYMTKFDFPASDVLELVNVMSNRVTIRTWGCVRFKLATFNVEDELNQPLAKIEACACRVCGGRNFKILEQVFLKHFELEDFYIPEKEIGMIDNE